MILTTKLSPEEAAAALAPLQERERMDVRIVPAVEGSIVRVRLHLRPFWYGLLALLIALWSISAAWSYALRKQLAPELFELRVSWLYEWHDTMPRVLGIAVLMTLIAMAWTLLRVRWKAIEALR